MAKIQKIGNNPSIYERKELLLDLFRTVRQYYFIVYFVAILMNIHRLSGDYDMMILLTYDVDFSTDNGKKEVA